MFAWTIVLAISFMETVTCLLPIRQNAELIMFLRVVKHAWDFDEADEVALIFCLLMISKIKLKPPKNTSL